MLDLTLAGIMLVSMLVSLFRGLVREVLSLASWIVAVFCAWFFGRMLGDSLAPMLGVGFHTSLIAGIVVFIAVILAGRIVTWGVVRIVAGVGLGLVDRLLGTVFGALRGILAVVVLLAVLEPFGSDTLWWNDSRMADVYRELRGELTGRLRG